MQPGDMAVVNQRGTFRVIGKKNGRRTIIGTYTCWVHAELAFLAAQDSEEYVNLDILPARE